MADAKGDLLLDEHRSPQKLSKRKPDAESAADESPTRELKKPKPETSPDPLPTQEGATDACQADHPKGGEENGEEEEEEAEVDEEGVNSNGKAAVDKGKGVVTAADKGKGKMAVEYDGGEDDEDGGDSDDSDDDDSEDVVAGGEDYESDFADDPLAEVDLSNILPSRTRRRDPPPPGAYLVNDLDGDDEDEEDDEVCD